MLLLNNLLELCGLGGCQRKDELVETNGFWPIFGKKAGLTYHRGAIGPFDAINKSEKTAHPVILPRIT